MNSDGDILYESLKAEFDKKILVLSTHENVEPMLSDNIWRCISFVTHDYDMLAEFIFKFKLQIKAVYFDPDQFWSFIRIPKIKLKWKNEVEQVKIGVKTYNILTGHWHDGNFIPSMENGECVIIPSVRIAQEHQVSTVLIPYGVDITYQDEPPGPEFEIEDVTCKYGITYYNISINRYGIYINRKYREIQHLIQLSELPSQFVIVEPKAYTIKDVKGNNIHLENSKHIS